MRLYSVYLGGRAEKCNIELHDIVFVVGRKLEETYPQLVEKWFGLSHRIHIDAYVELTHADGYAINIVPKNTAPESEYKLYFMNFGAYEPDLFSEVHQIAFYVAKDKTEAIARARGELCCGMIQTHCDDSLVVDDLIDSHEGLEIDDVIEISEVDGYRLQFTPLAEPRPLKIVPGYIKFLAALEKAGYPLPTLANKG